MEKFYITWNVKEYEGSTDFCIVDIQIKSEKTQLETSFTFSLVYLFAYVAPEDRCWFLRHVVDHYRKQLLTDEGEFLYCGFVEAYQIMKNIFDKRLNSVKI